MGQVNSSITDQAVEKFDQAVEKFGPTICLTDDQKTLLREALLGAGKPSSAASMAPQFKSQRKRKRRRPIASDAFLILTGVV